MRILHVITSLHPNGAETLVCNITPRFQQLGHQVDLCLFNGVETPLLKKLKENKDVKIHVLGQSYYNPWYIVKLARIMKNYDVIHTHNSSPQLFVAIANLVCRKKIVTTEHSTHNRKRDHWLLSKIDRWMYPQYDKVICISGQAETNLRKHLSGNEGNSEKTGKDNICTIYNGIDVALFHQATPINRRDVGCENDKFVFVMAASFREAKDQDTLIAAMKKLPKEKFELWLVGDGERVESLKLKVENWGMKDQVKFLGLRMDVPHILKAADVVVMSSHYEGLSLSNIEGMSVGKPFVASDVEGIHEVTQGFGVLFPHEDVDALVNIIQRLHDDRQFYQEVAERCYERAQQFDIQKMVEQYNMVYNSLAL